MATNPTLRATVFLDGSFGKMPFRKNLQRSLAARSTDAFARASRHSAPNLKGKNGSECLGHDSRRIWPDSLLRRGFTAVHCDCFQVTPSIKQLMPEEWKRRGETETGPV